MESARLPVVTRAASLTLDTKIIGAQERKIGKHDMHFAGQLSLWGRGQAVSGSQKRFGWSRAHVGRQDMQEAS